MGEVYRAQDPRLARVVAIKVLPASFAGTADRLRRFEQEARAAGALNHPNVLSVYDVDTHDGAPYLVTELLQGETLRARLVGGALTLARALDYARQIAQGLAAAHEKGIVHRDLKPENLFVTEDGRVKILDFGLAKLTQAEADGVSAESPTRTAATDAGTVLGTAGYMSPEQARGTASDHRSDVFSFGAILYEMLSGRRAFQGETSADTMTALLKEDPPALSTLKPAISPGLERVVRHCIEKNPADRFQSVRDLAFDLEMPSTMSEAGAGPSRASRSPRRRLAGAVVAFAAVLAAFGLGRRSSSTPVPAAGSLARFKRLTYGRGNLLSARFAPDGKTIVYSAAWEDTPSQLFTTSADSPESRALGIVGDLFGVSRSGELAIQTGMQFQMSAGGGGMLARVPMAGGAPREVSEGILAADWAPDGQSLAVVRDTGSGNRLEFPIGTPLYETSGSVSSLRVSPRGDAVAFLESEGAQFTLANPLSNTIVVVDRQGKATKLTRFATGNSQNLAWSPAGDEILFASAIQGVEGHLSAVSLSGVRREIAQVPGDIDLHDVSKAGDILVEQDLWRNGIVVGACGARERDLTWLASSLIADVSNEGSALFTEAGEAGGPNGAVYLRKPDGSPAVRLGEGMAVALSPDGRSALVLPRFDRDHLVLLPTGPGEARSLAKRDFMYSGARFLGDGEHIVSVGFAPGHAARAYVEDLRGGSPRPITPEGVAGYPVVSADGQALAVPMTGGRFLLYPLEGGEPDPLPGLEAGDSLLRFSADGQSMLVMRTGPLPTPVLEVDLVTGQRRPFKRLMPADPTGIGYIYRAVFSRDGASYAYSYGRVLYSNLYLLEGLK
jgi:dipeptidyl aminopeptidase/acylaminoacyl peptidase